jgi:putative transposase
VTDTNVIKLAQPGTFTDSLTEILRNGAHALLVPIVVFSKWAAGKRS